MTRLISQIGCIAIISLSGTARADTEASWARRIDIGGMVGLDLSSFAGPGSTSDYYIRYSYKAGLSIGGTIGVRLNKLVTAQTDIVFTTKGPRSTNNGMESGSYLFSYFELPLLARISLPIPSETKYHISLGPTLGILLDANIDLADGRHFDLDNSFKTIDVGLLFGAGAAVGVGEQGSVTFDIRYNRGLRNFDKTAAGADDEIVNQTFYFMVGYRTNLDTLLGGSSGASTSPQEPPSSPEPVPADAPTPAPPSDTQPTPAPTSPTGEPPVTGRAADRGRGDSPVVSLTK